MKEYGRIGQKRWEGQFYEEFLPELSGMRGIKVFQEMEKNDDTVGAILFAIKMMIRQVEWHVEPGAMVPRIRKLQSLLKAVWTTCRPHGQTPFRKSCHSCLTVGASMRLYISAEWVKQRTEDHQANTLMD